MEHSYKTLMKSLNFHSYKNLIESLRFNFHIFGAVWMGGVYKCTWVTVWLIWWLALDKSVSRASDYRFRGPGFESQTSTSLFLPFCYTCLHATAGFYLHRARQQPLWWWNQDPANRAEGWQAEGGVRTDGEDLPLGPEELLDQDRGEHRTEGGGQRDRNLWDHSRVTTEQLGLWMKWYVGNV